MKIVQAQPKDAKRILEFYNLIIDKMKNHFDKSRWIKDIYPSFDDIQNYCTNE